MRMGILHNNTDAEEVQENTVNSVLLTEAWFSGYIDNLRNWQLTCPHTNHLQENVLL